MACASGLRRSTLVEAHHHALADRMALAGEHEAVLHFLLFERVVLVHLHFAFEHAGAAGAAHAALACIRQRKPGFQADVEQAHALIGQTQLALLAVDNDFQLGGRRIRGDFDRRHARLRQRRAETFDVDIRLGHARDRERGFGGVHHRRGAADEGFVDLARRQQRVEERRALGLIEHAVEQLDVLQIVRQHVVEAEAVHEAVLQVLKLLREHDLVDAAVAVDQRERAARLRFERRLDDRQHRRDARATRERHVMLAVIGVQVREEAAVRRHHIDFVARRELIEGEVRETPAAHALDADAQFAVAVVVGHADADRVRAARFLASDMGLERDELSLRETVGVAQLGRHFECNGDRVRGFGTYFTDAQRMELRGGHISTV
ncbi:conserved hypothetical protein [Paraburkholderia tropica]